MVNDEIVIVIPVFNPNDKFVDLIEGLIGAGYKKIVVVNDGSNENLNLIDQIRLYEDVDVIDHVVNQGKGRALKTAFDYVLYQYGNCCGVITTDADGQHTQKDIQNCATMLQRKSKKNEMILGCRRFVRNKEVPFRSKFGNVCTCFILRVFCNLRVSDSQTGLRGIPMESIPELLVVPGERYEYEMNVLFAWNKIGHFREVSIDTIYEDNNSSSHFQPFKDSLKIYKVIIKHLFK